LLKIATVLNRAIQVAEADEEMEENENIHLRNTKFQENIKNIRQIASDVTDLGAKLYDLLQEELDLRKERQAAIAQPHNIDDIKDILSRKNSECEEIVTSLKNNIENVLKDEESLREKLNTKKADLVRSRKRLTRLQGFRPSYMDEFEVKEKELQDLYTQYVERHRNIEYLENELDKYRKAEAEAMEENKRRLAMLRKKMKEEELAIMRGDHQFGEYLSRGVSNGTMGDTSDNEDSESNEDNEEDSNEETEDEVEDEGSLSDHKEIGNMSEESSDEEEEEESSAGDYSVSDDEDSF
jgi:clusterin-associated protein 1